jgi:enoyl-CoA hydratase/carnithine racemase
MTDLVDVRREGRVMRITLNRPDRKNALTHAMYAAIADALEEAGRDDGVRCVVVTGRGDAFTSGNDIADFAGGMPEGTPPVVRFLAALRDLDTPVLVGVNGAAVGVGVTMLLHADLAYAADTATFRAPFAQLGLTPEAASSHLLPLSIGMAWANDMLIAGRVLTAAEALQAGLVSRVVPAAELPGLIDQVATDIADQAPTATRLTKQLIRWRREETAERMAAEATWFAAQLASAEFREAAMAFMQRRKPSFD